MPTDRYWRSPEEEGSYGTATMSRVGAAAELSLRKAERSWPAGLFDVSAFYDEGSATVEESRARDTEARAGNK